MSPLERRFRDYLMASTCIDGIRTLPASAGWFIDTGFRFEKKEGGDHHVMNVRPDEEPPKKEGFGWV